jgi:hypothetical protein
MFSHNPRQWQADSAQLGKMADSGFKERGTVAADWICAVWMARIPLPKCLKRTSTNSLVWRAGEREKGSLSKDRAYLASMPQPGWVDRSSKTRFQLVQFFYKKKLCVWLISLPGQAPLRF